MIINIVLSFIKNIYFFNKVNKYNKQELMEKGN